MADLFRSATLEYRALHPKDDPFLLSLDKKPGFSATPAIPVPEAQDLGLQRMAELRETYCRNCLLATTIWLPRKIPDLIRARMDEARYPFFIKDKIYDNPDHSQARVGVITLYGETPLFRQVELELTLHPHFQKHEPDLVTEAIRWALEWAFTHAGLHKVKVSAYEYSGPSVEIYQSIGFVLEGRLRDATWSNGKWWDEFVYSMLEDEWRAQQKNAEHAASLARRAPEAIPASTSNNTLKRKASVETPNRRA